MSKIQIILQLISIYFVITCCDEKFCDKNRKQLLGGVFNIEDTVYAYAWVESNAEDVSSNQHWVVWKYKTGGKVLVQDGKDTTIAETFPGIPLFKTGVALTMKCKSTDKTCQSYQGLVFVFYHSGYRTFRLQDDKFLPVPHSTNLPWSLQGRGESTDWAFEADIDVINGIALMAGIQSQLFVVSKSFLYKTSVDLKASAIKWTKLAESKEFLNVLGAFVSGNELFFNKQEEPDNVLVKYDQSGSELGKTSVWKYFGCEKAVAGTKQMASALEENNEESDSKNEKNTNIAVIIIICVFICIIMVNIIAGIFWLSVYRKKKNSNDS